MPSRANLLNAGPRIRLGGYRHEECRVDSAQPRPAGGRTERDHRGPGGWITALGPRLHGGARIPTGEPSLAQVLTDALAGGITRLPDGWAGRALASLRSSDREPSLEASARTLFVRTARAAIETLSALTGDSDSAPPSEVALAADLVSAAFAER